MPALFAVIGAIGNVLASSVARFVALKTLLIGLFMIVLPYVLHQIIYFFLDRGLNYANQYSGSLDSATVQLTKFGAWLGDALQVPLCLSIILSAVSIRLSLKLLRVV